MLMRVAALLIYSYDKLLPSQICAPVQVCVAL